jgi:hypothetical protein
MMIARSRNKENRFTNNPGPIRRLRVVRANLQQIKGQQSAYSAPCGPRRRHAWTPPES